MQPDRHAPYFICCVWQQEEKLLALSQGDYWAWGKSFHPSHKLGFPFYSASSSNHKAVEEIAFSKLLCCPLFLFKPLSIFPLNAWRMPASAGDCLWRSCPSKSVFGQHRDFIKGSYWNWTDLGAPCIQAPCHIHAHNWGQMSRGASISRKPLLCPASGTTVSAPQHSTQALCCFAVAPWMSVPSSEPAHGAAHWDLGAPWQTRGIDLLGQQGHLCHCLQLFLLRTWSHGCAGLLLRALGSAAGQDPGSVGLQGGGTNAAYHLAHGALPLPSPPQTSCGHAEDQGCWVWGRVPAMPVWLGPSLPGAWTSRV